MTQNSNQTNRRRQESQLLDEKMQDICKALIEQDLNVTSREVARQLGIAASSIVRDSIRQEILENAKLKQLEMRSWRKRQAKQSRDRDAENLAEKDIRIGELERQNELLIASHKAMVMAIGEFGGMAGWQRFFPHWQSVEEKLRELGAMPTAEIENPSFNPNRK